jgi:hypothetical protein
MGAAREAADKEEECLDQQFASSEDISVKHERLHNALIFCGLMFLVGLVIFVHFLVHFRS